MEIVQAYKSKNGRLFDTKEQSILEDIKEDLIAVLKLEQRPPIYGFSPNTIVQLIIEHKEEVIKILLAKE